ncbi:hypothetical protein PVAND_009542 [Polypedilum vanderplanki]|uniref:Odorant receptor n=1 Tax=Polypedilum vanderplanki TaxID=319348 RepID=A0A9J6CCW4_POLVA|nr:hypothetical protein PVAND_009542 [Polypedilum vanderplanki]
MSLSLVDKLKNQYAFMDEIAQIYGTNMGTFHPRLLIAICFLLVEQVMHIHGLIQCWSNPIDVCNGLMIYSIAIQLVVKLASRLLHNDDKLVSEIQKIINNFYDREQKIKQNRKILQKHLNNYECIMKIYSVAFLTLFLIPTITSAILSWYTGEFILFSPIYLPLTDPTKKFGYFLNFIIMGFESILTCLIFLPADLLYINFAYQTVPMSQIFIKKLKKFGNEIIEIENNKCEENSIKFMSKYSVQKEHEKQQKLEEENFLKLKELIKEFNEYNNLISLSLKYMSFTSFIAISTNAIAISMAIIILFFFSVSIGFAASIIFLIQMLNPCMQGSLIVHQNTKIFDAIYDFPWYYLTEEQKKIYLQFIHLSQNAKKLRILILDELNMELFTKALNACYTYMMFIWNIMK